MPERCVPRCPGDRAPAPPPCLATLPSLTTSRSLTLQSALSQGLWAPVLGPAEGCPWPRGLLAARRRCRGGSAVEGGLAGEGPVFALQPPACAPDLLNWGATRAERAQKACVLVRSGFSADRPAGVLSAASTRRESRMAFTGSSTPAGGAGEKWPAVLYTCAAALALAAH